MATIIENLNKLAELHSALYKKMQELDDLKNSLIPDEIKEKITELEQEFDVPISYFQDSIQELECAIKQAVYARGETVKGDRLMAVFTKGRQTWDNKGLDLYADLHPDILEFRKIGEPGVSIREVK